MSANSLPRRVLKRLLHPVLNERSYRWIQSRAKARDIRRGSWTEPELDLIPYGIRPGETAFDIGANYGLYSEHLSRAVGPGGRVYAFEPVPFVYETFRLVGKQLGWRNVTLVPKGCSDRSGTLRFTLPIQASGAISGGLAHIGLRDNERRGKDLHFPYAKTAEITCEVVALDELFPDLSNLSFIKCDVEGAELLALRGARHLVERCRPTIVCEINPWFLEGYGIRLSEFLDFFLSRGYGAYRVGEGNSPRRLRSVSEREIVEDNYVFLHPRYLDRYSDLLA